MNKGKREIGLTGLVIDYSPVTAEKILTPEDSAKNGVQTTRHRVQLRQHINVTYPAAKGNALFAAEEFGLGKGQTFEEKRVCWLNVPAAATVEQIQRKIEEMDSPKLVRALSLKPILSVDQIRTMENGVNKKTYEDYLNDFVVDGEGNPVLFRGEKQYRNVRFSKSWTEDEDNRSLDYQEVKGGAVQMARAAGKEVPAKI